MGDQDSFVLFIAQEEYADDGSYSIQKAKIKVSGDIWIFHKYDPDDCNWGTELHGHDYDKSRIVTADGEIYDKVTKKHLGAYKRGKLVAFQKQLDRFKLPKYYL